jgi:ribosomal-protein-alanine N-acetyltransferase
MIIDKTKLELKEFSKEDIEAVLAIEEDLFPNPWTYDMFDEDVSSQDNFVKEVAGRELRCKTNYLLKYDGEVIAFYMGWAIFDEYSVLNIGVKRSYQSQGLGSYLLEDMILKAVELQCNVIYLEVRASNSSAIKLYEKFNFEQIGLRKGYYTQPKEDAIVMKHEIKLD